jgi:hypothetical protein
LLLTNATTAIAEAAARDASADATLMWANGDRASYSV